MKRKVARPGPKRKKTKDMRKEDSNKVKKEKKGKKIKAR